MASMRTLCSFIFLFFHRAHSYTLVPCAVIMICNNDLLVPDGTISKLAAALTPDRPWAWVLPVVSHRYQTSTQAPRSLSRVLFSSFVFH